VEEKGVDNEGELIRVSDSLWERDWTHDKSPELFTGEDSKLGSLFK